jgi:formylglycine-generating enzyme
VTRRRWFLHSAGCAVAAFAVLASGASAEAPRVEGDPVAMVWIPDGPFRMGSLPAEGRPDEQPQHTVLVDAFWIDRVEVTNARYQTFVEETGHRVPPNPYGDGMLTVMSEIEDLPVVLVTWHDAADYCEWAGKRLPTEAEWEKAARGTDARRFPWGDDPPTPAHGTFAREWDGTHTLHPVGTRPDGRSPFGVDDLAGNAREWVQDWYAADFYSVAPDRNPVGPAAGILKVIRGGSWRSPIADIGTAARGRGGFALQTHGTGFRCARSADSSSPMEKP